MVRVRYRGQAVEQKDLIRVLVADDEMVIRAALSDLLVTEPGFELAGAAANAAEAVELAAAQAPDVALLDVRMPGGGLAAAEGIREASPATRVLILSASDDREASVEMFRAGAVGFLLKGGRVDDILSGIRDAMQGGVRPPVRDLDDAEAPPPWRTLHPAQTLAAVRRFIDGNDMRVVLQPVVELSSRVVLGYEAFTRFDVQPLRSPSEWLAAADSVGFGLELELAALELALGELAHLPADCYLAVNISARTAASPQLAAVLRLASADRVVLEIYEHQDLVDYESLGATLAPLRQSGLRVAVDDARSGASTLRHVLQLSPDLIKLDIRRPGGRRLDESGVAALASFARTLGAELVVEGIETASEFETLVALGVRYGQGYELGRPAPANQRSAAAPPRGATEAMIGRAFASVPIPMALLAGSGEVLFANDALGLLVGRPADDLRWINYSLLLDIEQRLTAPGAGNPGAADGSTSRVVVLTCDGPRTMSQQVAAVPTPGRLDALVVSLVAADTVEAVDGGTVAVRSDPIARRPTGERARALAEISNQLAERATDLQFVLGHLTERAAALIGGGAAVRLLSDDDQWLEAVAAHAYDPELSGMAQAIVGRRWRLAEPGIGSAIRRGSPVRLHLADRPALEAALPPDLVELAITHGLRNFISAPLVVGGRVMGDVCISTTADHVYSEDDVAFATDLAARASIALQTARLFEAMRGELADRKRAEATLEDTVQKLHKSAQERRTLLDHLLRATEAERERIAADVHDDSIQAMVAVSIRLQLLRRQLTDERGLGLLTQLEDVTTSAIVRLRRLLVELRPPTLDAEGMGTALREALESSFEDTTVEWSVNADGPVSAWSPEQRTVLYRVAQEAIINARKHAQPSRIDVEVMETDDRIGLRVIDDGMGFDPSAVEALPARGHIGLLSMRQRVELVGGSVGVWSVHGIGTVVECWVPR